MVTPFKKQVKAKLMANKELTEEMKERERIKYEIAEELGLLDKVKEVGWDNLTSSETGKIGGMMTKRNKIEGRKWNK